MKKRLICFLILSSFIIGLVFVGSCKDYDDFALDIKVQNLDNRLDANSKSLSDSIDSIMARLGRIKQCSCVPSTIKDSIAVLYNYLGDVSKTDTCSIDTATGKPLKGIGKIVNYLNKQLTLMAAQADVESLKQRIDKLYKDSIKPGFDTASIALDSAKLNAANLRKVADDLRKMRYSWSDSVKRALDTANLAYAMADQNSKDIKVLQGREKVLTDSLKLAWDSIRDHLARIEILEARRDIHTYYDSLRHAVQRADSNKVSIDSLAKVTDELIQKDIVLNKRIDSLAKVTYNDSVRVDGVIQKNVEQDKRIDSLAKVTYNDSIRTKAYLDSALAHADSIADTIRGDIAKVIKAYQAADAKLWAAISPMIDSIRSAHDSINNHRIVLDALTDSLSDHRKDIQSLYDSISDHRKEINNLYDSIVDIRVRLTTVERTVDTLKAKVDSLSDARMKNISGIDIQGTRNDVFGSFALPVDMRSNILMTYYSDFPGAKFPSVTSTLKGSAEITAKDWAVIKSAQKTLGSGRVVEESSDNAGKLYFTLNPNDVKIDDTYEFYLMTSDGHKTPVALNNIQKSTEKLTFGLSTGLFVNGQVVEDNINTVNGFYQADAKIEAKDAYSLRPHLDVDKEELKAVALDVKNFKDGVDLKGMASTLINTVLRATDGILDANALYVSWSDAYGKHSATSKYNVAAFAVKPLSYNTFNSLSLPDIKIPDNPIQYLLNRAEKKAKSEANKITFHFKKINIKNVTFTLPDVTFVADDVDPDKPIIIYLEVTSNGEVIRDTVTVPFETAYMSVRDPLMDALNTLNEYIDITADEMTAVIESMRNDINTQLNDFIDDIQVTVRSSVKKAIGELATEVGNNKYVKKLETLASKMSSFYNKYSDGFGRYMVQPMLLYLDDSGDLHPMSKSVTVPTQSTTNSFDLIMTSLTNEIVTPAYKKFVAVTNYIDPVSHKDYQYNNDDAAKAVITGINGNGEIGVVLDGSTKSVTFNAPQKGTYELLLSTIDYDGYVFNRKFYVTVK